MTWATPISAGAWNSVVAYHDSVNNFLGISVNGGTFTKLSHSGGVFTGGSSVIGIGGNPAVSSAYWSGRIDNPWFWNRVLTQAEATEFHNGGAGKEWPA